MGWTCQGTSHHRDLRRLRGEISALGAAARTGPDLPGRTSVKLPADYPADLYWKGQPPKEEYNYVLVDVKPGEKTRFTLSRFRPWSAEPIDTVELFK